MTIYMRRTDARQWWIPIWWNKMFEMQRFFVFFFREEPLIHASAPECEWCGSRTSCHGGCILNNISCLSVRIAWGGAGRWKLQEIMFESVRSVRAIWYYKATPGHLPFLFWYADSFFSHLSASSPASRGKPVLTTSIRFTRKFLSLFWSRNLLWITHVCCGGCHRSLPYKITIRLPVFARNRPFFFFSPLLFPPSLSLALVVSSASFDASAGKHQDTNLFGFFILRKDDVFFFFFVLPLLRILYLFSVPGWRKKKNTVAIRVKQMVIY